jgi:hypothetical protein
MFKGTKDVGHSSLLDERARMGANHKEMGKMSTRSTTQSIRQHSSVIPNSRLLQLNSKINALAPDD